MKDKRRSTKAAITPKPEWVEAFMILLLHKVGGSLTVSLKSLDNFGKLKRNYKTLISFDPDNNTVTIRTPEVRPPERIITPKSSIITE